MRFKIVFCLALSLSCLPLQDFSSQVIFGLDCLHLATFGGTNDQDLGKITSKALSASPFVLEKPNLI